ncbi:MAG: dTDP-4-dehydrorhamnose reductase [Deltaproteobacteria bacterium]|nr:dTDP-4-dehydrorhamnose reductase [Deltaproteobacteria bacterium]
MEQIWAITGAEGQLGQSLAALLESRSASFCAWSRQEMDIGDAARVDARLSALARQCSAVSGECEAVLINAAAFTAVDLCESERETATRVNEQGPQLLASACEKYGIHLVQVSTDYVFDGCAQQPYEVGSETNPRSFYGVSKLAGEGPVLAVGGLVVRSSWLFGPGRNFAVAILEQAAKRRSGEVEGPLRVVEDQRGCPTYTVDLAAGIVQLVEAGAQGLYHLANSGSATWREFARAILDGGGYSDLEVEPIATGDLSLSAPRPGYSVLSCARATQSGVTMRPWQDALMAYLDEQQRSKTKT